MAKARRYVWCFHADDFLGTDALSLEEVPPPNAWWRRGSSADGCTCDRIATSPLRLFPSSRNARVPAVPAQPRGAFLAAAGDAGSDAGFRHLFLHRSARVRSRQLPPFEDPTMTESIAQRDQSSSRQAPSSSRTIGYSLAHIRPWTTGRNAGRR